MTNNCKFSEVKSSVYKFWLHHKTDRRTDSKKANDLK